MTDATLTRSANTARDVMTENPVSIHEHTTLQEAADFLIKRRISAAPVINDAGRAVGVLSRTDIVRFSRGVLDVPQPPGDFVNEALDLDGQAANLVTVSQVMTPVVLSIDLDSSLAEVCDKMLDQEVHRLFVVDQDEILVGVISALDVLRCLRR